MRTKQYPFVAALCLPLWTTMALHAQSGTLDPAFNGTGYVIDPVTTGDNGRKILVQPDQKVLVVGMSFDPSFVSRAQVFRYLPDGSPDTEFATDGQFSYEQDFEANLYSAVLTPEGKIVLVGSTTDYQGYRMLLIQLDEDGALDAGFGTGGVVLQTISPVPANGEDMGFDVALDADNNILVCGSSFGAAYESRPVVVRFTPNGTLDTGFGVGGVATIPTLEYACDFKGIAVQPDGKIVAAGTFGSGLLWWELLVVRFLADGSLDPDFGDAGVVKFNYGNVDDEAEDLALLPDGSILVAGFTVTVDYNFSALLVKFTPEGELDAAFGNAGVVMEDLDTFDYASNVAVLEDGKIVLAGTSGDGPPGAFDMAVWKYQATGARDPGFGNNGVAQPAIPDHSAMIYGLDVQADGNILIGGQARTSINQNYFLTVRLLNDLSSSVADLSSDGVLPVYPNPAIAGGQVTLHITEALGAGARISLYAPDGRLVHAYAVQDVQRAAQGGSVALPGGLAPGLYRFTVEQADTRRVASILIAR